MLRRILTAMSFHITNVFILGCSLSEVLSIGNNGSVKCALSALFWLNGMLLFQFQCQNATHGMEYWKVRGSLIGLFVRKLCEQCQRIRSMGISSFQSRGRAWGEVINSVLATGKHKLRLVLMDWQPGGGVWSGWRMCGELCMGHVSILVFCVLHLSHEIGCNTWSVDRFY